MNITHKKLWAAIFGSALLGATETKAVNITVQDYAPALNHWNQGPATSIEDNEVERVGSTIALRGQHWDLEAFVVKGTKLVLIGGYDLQAGYPNPGTASNPLQLPGDLFIRTGGFVPGPGNSTEPAINSDYGYSHAVILSTGAFGPTATVQILDNDSRFNTVQHDVLASNPWKYLDGAASSTTTGIEYFAGLTQAQIAAAYGVQLRADGGVSVDGTPAYELHNALEIDMAFLGGAQQIALSYTMQCGNDSLKGFNEGGFTLVPDGGMSLALLGMGLGGLLMAARSRK